MKFEVGDRVKVRSWKSMSKEFGLTDSGSIKTNNFPFGLNRERYCQKVMTVKETCNTFYVMKEDCGFCCWTDEMLEPVEFD